MQKPTKQSDDQKNLTGEQIQNVLDLFLYKALEPIILYTTAFDNQVVYLLGIITRNKKRKLTSISREDSISLLCRYIITDDRKLKFELLKKVRLERNFLHTFLRSYLNKAGNYTELYDSYITSKKRKRKKVGTEIKALSKVLKTDPRSLYIICVNSSVALDYFFKYRQDILNDYVKLSSKQAKAFISTNTGNYDFLDVRQTILKSILTAIDKYDSIKGPLTSYINWWVLNALTCGSHEYEYGVAYSIPKAYKRKIATDKNFDVVNFSVSLDTLLTNDDQEEGTMHSFISDGADVTMEMERDDEARIVQYITKCVDKHGVLRLSSDIGEFFTEEELKIMKKISYQTLRNELKRKS